MHAWCRWWQGPPPVPLLWPGLWHHQRPLQARGGEVPGPAGAEHRGVQAEVPAPAEEGEVPAPP